MTDPRPPRRVCHGLALALAAGLAGTGCSSLRPLAHETGSVSPLPRPGESASGVTTPGQYHLRLSQYVFYSDFPLKADTPLLQELVELRDQVCKELQLPTADRLIQVFLFEDRDRYERFMKARYPDLPRRRAFFVAQPRTAGGADELFVYTFYGDHVRQDLRHELTHALLHCVLRDVPLWLDEGLAEYFELPPEDDGINAQHLETLQHGPFQPDLNRLEGLSQVDQMKPGEYREAWAWAHLMLRGRPEARAALLGYLQLLRTHTNPGLLLPRLQAVYPDLNTALASHLVQLEQRVALSPGRW